MAPRRLRPGVGDPHTVWVTRGLIVSSHSNFARYARSYVSTEPLSDAGTFSANLDPAGWLDRLTNQGAI